MLRKKKDWKTADFHILATIIEFNVQWISQHHFAMKGKYRGNSIVTWPVERLFIWDWQKLQVLFMKIENLRKDSKTWETWRMSETPLNCSQVKRSQVKWNCPSIWSISFNFAAKEHDEIRDSSTIRESGKQFWVDTA